MGFTERLNALLNEREVGYSDVVAATGISKSAYYRYMTGEREPTMSALIKLAKFFNVSTDYLVGRSNTPTRLP